MTTMILDPPPRTTSLGVGLNAGQRRTGENAAAWKNAIGTKPIPARLATLPEPKRQWDRLGISAAVQIGFVIFLLAIPYFYPETLKTALHYDITELAQPLTTVPVAPPPPKVRAKTPPPVPKPVEPEPVKLNPKQQHIFITPKAIQPPVKRTETRAPELNPVFEAAKVDTSMPNAPKRPREEVKMNNLSSGSAAPATVVAPVEKVQTGGFGDPNGLPGKADPRHRANVNALGSPLLPGGPGYGNGTGGAKGIRGTVASTGFGNGTANPPPSGGRRGGTVQASGFGDQTVAEAPKKKASPTGPIDTPVDILSKPRPEYTAEGRSLRLEGDVVIDLVFLASGGIQINRVVSGLGHGLDEAAVRAAEQIRFKPAKREGQPVDFPARVRIEFRLAY